MRGFFLVRQSRCNPRSGLSLGAMLSQLYCLVLLLFWTVVLTPRTAPWFLPPGKISRQHSDAPLFLSGGTIGSAIGSDGNARHLFNHVLPSKVRVRVVVFPGERTVIIDPFFLHQPSRFDDVIAAVLHPDRISRKDRDVIVGVDEFKYIRTGEGWAGQNDEAQFSFCLG